MPGSSTVARQVFHRLAMRAYSSSFYLAGAFNGEIARVPLIRAWWSSAVSIVSWLSRREFAGGNSLGGGAEGITWEWGGGLHLVRGGY